MARPLRISFPGAVYHVMSRGNNRQTVLIDDQDCNRYLEILEETMEMFHVILYAYVLMGNHVHLLIKTPEANLSEFMRRLNLTYTSYINRRHRRIGHLFQGRFKSHLVEEDRYLVALSRYIHLNPLRVRAIKSLSAKEKMNYLKTYPWSSLDGYRRGNKQRAFVSYDFLLEPYGGNTSQGRRIYWASLGKMVNKGEETEYPGKLLGGWILSSLEYASEVLDRIRTDESKKMDQAIPLMRHVSYATIWDRIKEVTGQSKREVLNDHGVVRDMVMELLCSHSGHKGSEVAKIFDLSDSAVSKYRKRIRKKIGEEKNLASLWESLERSQ